MASIVLKARDRALLNLVGRYRVGTREIFHRLFFEKVSMDAVKSVLGRLCANPAGAYLVARPLIGKEVYYQLTEFGARQLGFPDEWAKPLGPQALISHFAIMSWCCADPSQRKLFLRDEWGKAFPEFAEYFQHYVLLQVAGQATLTRLKVDMGGDAARLVQTCETLIRAASKTPGLNDLVFQKLYALAVLTAEESKAERIRENLKSTALPVCVEVHVVSDLTKVLSRKSGVEKGDDDAN